MDREHDLLTELRAARKALNEARGAEQHARAMLSEARAARMKAAALVEEVLDEVETGKTSRPLIDAVNGLAARGAGKPPDPPEDETADERQRGPTAAKRADRREVIIKDSPNDKYEAMFLESQSPGVPDPAAGQKRPKQAAAKPAVPGPLNQDAALLRACWLSTVWDQWADLKPGATDGQIETVLRQWPTHQFRGGKDGNAWAVHGGPDPRFYYDSDCDQWGDPRGTCTLRGTDLIRAVRRVCHIRQPKPTKADGKPVRSRKPAAATP